MPTSALDRIAQHGLKVFLRFDTDRRCWMGWTNIMTAPAVECGNPPWFFTKNAKGAPAGFSPLGYTHAAEHEDAEKVAADLFAQYEALAKGPIGPYLALNEEGKKLVTAPLVRSTPATPRTRSRPTPPVAPRIRERSR